MKLKEIFEKADILHDSKARRRSNLSDTVADISVADIQAGITIEQLENLNVPVKQYATQITIHGVLPDVTNKTVCGYQTITKNQNGSIGVKYIAIDGAKKQLIKDVSRYGNDKTYHCNIDSQGMTLTARTMDKQTCIDLYKAFPDNLIVGSKTAAKGMYGEYYVFINLGAIYTENIWPLLNQVFGITETEYNAKIEQEHIAADIAKAERLQAEIDKKQALETAKRDCTLRPLTVVPKTGQYIKLAMSRQGNPEFYLYTLEKRIGKIYVTVSHNGKELYCKIYDKVKAILDNTACNEGRLFHA
jgi:hypothetical protein